MRIELELAIFFLPFSFYLIYVRLVQEYEDVSPMFVSAIQSPLQNTPFSHKTQKQDHCQIKEKGKKRMFIIHLSTLFVNDYTLIGSDRMMATKANVRSQGS